MDYSEALSYLERLGDEVLTMKLGLERMRVLLAALGNPQNRLASVLVGGTDGKGSVAHFLSSICLEADLAHGLYTSPHLCRVEERIRVNGEVIGDASFARSLGDVVGVIKSMGESGHPTYFETLTAAALLHFERAALPLAILEVGLGGRLDSSNAVEPIFSLLTPISYDHQQILGRTLPQIAGEKAGILRAGRPAISASQPPQVQKTLRSRARRLGARLREVDPRQVEILGHEEGRYAFRYRGLECQLALHGRHQVGNALLAIEAAQQLRREGFRLPQEAIRRGIERMSLPGRIQRVPGTPVLFLDGAHNPQAAAALQAFVERHTAGPRALLFAIMRDKDAPRILQVLAPDFEKFCLTRVDSPRSADPARLKPLLPGARLFSHPREALEQARSGVRTVVAAGSFYLVGELLVALGLEKATRSRREVPRP